MGAGTRDTGPGTRESCRTPVADGNPSRFTAEELCQASFPRLPGPGSRAPAVSAKTMSGPDSDSYRVTAHQQGFTLLEMIVVLLIIATMATLLGTSIVGRLDSVKVATAARDLTAAMRYTRSQAILHREEKFVEINLEQRSYVAAGRPAVELPETMELKLLTAQSEVDSDKVGRIRFFSDGGSTGGTVTLISDGRQWKVKVSWLTGEIELDDGRRERR